MARISGTKHVTNNSFQAVESTGTVFINAGTPTNEGSIYIDSKNGTVYINRSGDVVVNEDGGNVFINEGGGNVSINDGGNGDVEINRSGGGDVTINRDGSGTLFVGDRAIYEGTDNVGNLINNPTGAQQLDIDQTKFSTTEQRQLASVYFSGGVGIEQDLAVGGFIYGRIAESLTTTNVLVTATNADQEFYPIFVNEFTATGTVLYGDDGEFDLRYNPSAGRLTTNRLRVANTETSTSTDTGAAQISGGLSVAQDITIGGVVYGYNDFTTQYLEGIYDKYLGLKATTSKIALAAGATDIFGEIQVRGKNPIGTGPVVTNVLYVTVDGNDTNDGRAQDPSRACRTIGGALKSPFYQPGTQIRVSAGRYLENNPLELKPYTSIMGSDIRTTFIEPINKTQDLFHLTSGCYLAFMTFLNGRSGRLQGDYAPGTNRGAYATAFPPQTGDNRIDLFHSPYVQNCTNQSGPWLYDGTMFIPSQTVQIPKVVGTGTWAANTTSIVVNASTGTIEIGQYVNAGQQNPGFFDARTLLLANKPFLQSQVVAFVDYTFNSGAFVYNQTKCRRDTELILNAIGMDMLYDSKSDSTFAGLQYWNQGSYTGDIPNEITATIAAMVYLNGIVNTYVDSSVTASIDTLFSTLTNILSVGTTGVTDWVTYGTLPSTATTLVSSVNALQTNKAAMQQAVVDWVNTSYPTLVYNTASCYRDVGYIIDSVSFDILHGGNVQTIKSGVYYYTYSTTSTAIPNEVPQTTAAYNYIKSILPNIVTGTPLPTTYQTGTAQVIVGDAGNVFDADVLESKLDVITDIIRNGPSVAPTKDSMPLELNTATSALNAYSLLLANTTFIKEEVIAYIDQTMNNFQYNRQKCYRDVAILVENMAYDMAFGGNQKSIESGLAYYDGVISVIAGQETQTISAIDYLSELCKQIVVNTTCTVLPVPTEIPSNSQVINTALIGGAIAIDPIEKLFNITTSIIEDGPSAAPAVYTSPGPDAAFVSAEILMQANRTFIQENTLNYINHVLCYPPKNLPYNQIKCRRDAGVILDSIASDMYFGGYSQSTFAGRQYYAIDGYTGSIKTEIQPTIRAVRYLRDMSLKIVQSITTATDAQAGITRYSTGTQFTSTNIASADALDTIELEFNTILNILGGHVTGWTDNIVPNGGIQTNSPGILNAISLLQTNKLYLEQEVLAYITATNAGFVFDQVTCQRDIGYMIDAVSFDLKYGGNRMAVQSGLGYYDNVGTQNVVENEVTATIAAFNYMASVAGKLITGTNYVPIQTTVKPVLNLSTGTIDDVEKMQAALNTITNIILNGPTVAGAQYPSPLTPQSTINNFDEAKCLRDTGFIVNAIGHDMMYSSSSDSQFAGLQYWNQGEINGVPATELAATIAAVGYLSTVAQSYLSPTGDAIVSNLLSTVTNILTSGTSIISSTIVYGGLPSTDPGTVSDYNALQTNKAAMQIDVVNWVVANYPSLVFNTSTCYRDVGYMIDSVSFDLLHGGNAQSMKSGAYYYEFNSASSAIPDEIPQTTLAYSYMQEILPYIVRGLPVPKTYQSAVSQVTSGTPGALSNASVLNSKVEYILSIIRGGPGVAGTRTPIGLTQDPSTVDAYNLLIANKEFIKKEVVAYIYSFAFDQVKCRRDIGFIVNSIGFDMLYNSTSDSQFSGLQYWNQGALDGVLPAEVTATIAAITYLSGVAQGYVSITNAPRIGELITTVTNILTFGTDGISDIIQYGGLPSTDTEVLADYAALQTNKAAMQADVVNWVTVNYPSLVFNTSTCYRDVGYIVDSISFDLLHGGSAQSVKSGAYYYSFLSTSTAIPNEIPQTTAAYNYMKTLMSYVITTNPLPTPYQTSVPQTLGLPPATSNQVTALQNKLDFIVNIITNGPAAAGSRIPLTGSIGDSNAIRAWNLLKANENFIKEEVLAYVNKVWNESLNAFEIIRRNRAFLAAETVAWLDATYNPNSFNYDQDLCYRDTGLIVDAVSQDILLGGNQKSLEAGLSYWNKGYNYVSGQISTTTAAINYAKDISLKIIANQPVTPSTGTVATQVINTFFEYGGNYMPQEAVIRNFGIVTNIIENGPSAAPPAYAGGGLFALTGLNGSDVLPPPQVTRVETISPGKYLVGLSTATIGFGLNSTLYFGNIWVFPLQNSQVEELSLEYTGSTSTWDQRKVDPIGSMGGSLVDGATISDRSPIQSFVYDAFTQVSQGGIGIHITNNGYAQLVSVFTIFNSIGVLCDNGGIASITNSNCNFGDISIMSKGYGPRKFSGTVFNPAFRSYPFSPNGVDGNGDPLPYLDQFYPTGYWPNLGRVMVFTPDEDDRPHIGLVMEVIPPDGHLNEQGFPGFLNAQPSTSTLATGTIVLTNISTDDVSIGNAVYIRDQFGKQYDDFTYLHDPDGNPVDALGNRVANPSLAPPNPNYLKWYAATGTVVTDVNYNAITLNQALTNGGGDIANPTYFTIYFCGNSYYTVQTSSRAADPYQPNTNKLAANTSTYYQGPATSQIAAHIDSLNHLKTCVGDIIANVLITKTPGNTSTQVVNTTVIGGADAKDFIDLRMDYITSIVGAANITAANAVVPPISRTREGAIAPGSGAAVTLIELNIDFLAAEVAAYAVLNWSTELNTSQAAQRAKCERDVKIILQAMIYDLETGGNYNSVYGGLSYWMTPGTYHIVTLGEAVRRPDLFPDGSTLNFYQRSYISASGYLFEYVGAGTNYGALPQRGVADPDQLKEVVQLNNGKVFFTSTDQNGDFRIGPGLVIAQATGVLTGRTFVQSLYANMTPFILAIE